MIGDIESPWQFTNQRYDQETELIHFLKRYYNPVTGRWLTTDPLGFADGPNLYAYVHNNPLGFVDPYGLWGESVTSWGKEFMRAFVDDQTWGASDYALGKHNYTSMTAYGAGTIASLGVGLLYGGTEAKAVKYLGKGFGYLGKGAYKIFKGTKTASKFANTGKNLKNVRQIGKIESNLTKIERTASNFGKGNKYLAPKKAVEKTIPKGHIWQKASPFKEKSANELDQFRNKGYLPFGTDPLNGKGSYVNPQNYRQYHIAPFRIGRYREPNHVDVSRVNSYTGLLKKRRFGYANE